MEQARRMRDLALTGRADRLPNRRHFLELAHGAVAQAQRDHTPLAFAALDIDHLSASTTPTATPWATWCCNAYRTRRVALRPGDVIGRIGGEEFLVLLRGTTLDQA
jgi:GGDEF domain-containing protein